ncbi:MAG: hypothetical protein OXF02_03980 [Simkaniaceae bacterium]|nr:hypothetical protein [Simkaniaceae bacterium]
MRSDVVTGGGRGYGGAPDDDFARWRAGWSGRSMSSRLTCSVGALAGRKTSGRISGSKGHVRVGPYRRRPDPLRTDRAAGVRERNGNNTLIEKKWGWQPPFPSGA